jgi:eukaryotic-like serine/threonine-protein kinase
MGLPLPPKPGAWAIGRRDHDRLRPGAILLGRYRIDRELGRGGMAVVLAASHITIGAPVAVKVLHASTAAKRTAVDRFLTEARAIAAVQHPNVVRVSDYGELSDGRPFMVMEYLRGRDLARDLEGSAPLPWSTVKPILLQVCAALQAAHDVGIVHRDVKPQNIFLLDDGAPFTRVKVLDFGIAKVGDALRAEGQEDEKSTFVGTPDYMAPEQSNGSEIDARADVYALGVTLYRALTGQLPFVSEHWFHTVTQHMYRTPPRPRSINAAIPEQVEALILRALEKQPSERFASMAELAEAAEATPDEDESQTSGAITRSSIASEPRSHGRGWALGASALAAGAVAFWGWLQLSPDPLEAGPPPAEPTAAVRAASLAPVPRVRERVVPATAIELEPPTKSEPIEPAAAPIEPARVVVPPPPEAATKLRAAPRVPRPAPRVAVAPARTTTTATPEPPPPKPAEPAPSPMRIEEVKDPFGQ